MNKLYINDRELFGLKSIPNMGVTKRSNPVLNYTHSSQNYIAGIYKENNLIFGFYYNNEEKGNLSSEIVDESYKMVRKYELSRKNVRWKLEFEDGTYVEWTSKVDTKIKKYNLDGIIEFDIISILNKLSLERR